MPEGHLVSAFPLCQPCSTPQGQAESGGMVLVAYAGSVHPAAALRDSVLCLPTDIHSLFVNKPSSSPSSPCISEGFLIVTEVKLYLYFASDGKDSDAVG